MDKDPKLIIHTTKPANAEPPLDELRENYITPQPLYYVRNHGEIPEIDEKTFRLKINGLVEREIEVSMAMIKNDFQKRTIMSVLMCAGNRRVQMIEFAPVPGEVPWDQAAVGNAYWSGVSLWEVLALAGVKPEATFVAFMGADDVYRNGENVGFGASIPIEKARSEDVLLAYEMNGKPLEPTHGFPLRVVVPGYIGARSVKWLMTITLQTEPSKNYFQDHAYRLFKPEDRPETVDWETGIQLSELDVNCVISSPLDNEKHQAGKLTVKGFALTGGERIIIRVEVSIDNGNSWQEAAITEGNRKYAWVFWEIEYEFAAGEHVVIARAFDNADNGQPEDVSAVWNFKGYMNNSWHKVRFTMA